MISAPQIIRRETLSTDVDRFDLDVGIVYTHEHDFIGPLVSTLRASQGDLRLRLLLVDNDSDEGVERWRRLIPDTAVLRNFVRLPYAANLNRIVAASSARYVLLLNTDMFFDPRQQCPARMVEFMDAHPECGMAGCRIVHPDGRDARSARRFQNLATILARRCGLGPVLRRTLDNYFYAQHDPHDTFACDWLSGCFLMLRRQAIHDVGAFDEGFGKYFEDVDMGLRMARAGWQVQYNGRTSCVHFEQRGSRNLLSADARRHAWAYLRWLRKWGFSRSRFLPPEPSQVSQLRLTRREMRIAEPAPYSSRST